MQELPPLPSGIRTLTDAERARLLRRNDNVPASPDDCITCKGTGEFPWWHEDERTGKESVESYKCNCRDQWVLHRYLLNANVGIAYQRLGWRDVQAESGAREKIADYLENLYAYVNAGVGLILVGKMGTGKTLLSTLVLKTALGMGIDGYFTTFAEMIDMYTSGWYDLDEKTWFHRRIKNVRLLVLDDVGRELKGSMNIPEATFDEVFRHRVSHALPTIITSNIGLKGMTEMYGRNILSLFQEATTTYEFIGENFRDRKRMRTDEEVAKNLTRPVMLG